MVSGSLVLLPVSEEQRLYAVYCSEKTHHGISLGSPVVWVRPASDQRRQPPHEFLWAEAISQHNYLISWLINWRDEKHYKKLIAAALKAHYFPKSA